MLGGRPVPKSLSDAKLVENFKLFHTRVKNIFCWGLESLKVVYARHARTFAPKKKAWGKSKQSGVLCCIFNLANTTYSEVFEVSS